MRAGLELIAAVSALKAPVSLQTRVGIATGLVVVGDLLGSGPGLSGIELQNRLISDGYHMPTIFISAFPNTQIEQRVLQSGAIAYLRKPFNDDELLEHIETAVKRRRG